MAKFQPGQSGNPNGRPKKGKTLTDILEKKLDKEKFVLELIDLAETGNMAAIKEILERIEGKVADRQRFVDEDDNDVNINVNINDVK